MGRFRSLYQSTFNDIFAYTTRALAPDESEIDDVVAEIYLVAWRRLDELPQSPEDRLWLFGVARNIVRNTKRSTNRRILLMDRIQRQPRMVIGSSEPSAVDVTDALQRLSSNDREVIQLVVWDGLSPAEIAEVLHCSVNVVQVRLHRARRRLARRLRTANEDPNSGGAGGVQTTGINTFQMDTENP
jgi:RNA polymerase sigma factor (sigma-70 family)